MTRRSSVRRLVAGLAVGVAVLGGCSDEQEASQSLPTTSSGDGDGGTSSAAPTEEALPPLGPADMPMPDAARIQDAAGAEAFVRYYLDLVNRSLTDMDPQYLRQFAADGCEVCERISRETESDAAQGYTYRGGELTIIDGMSATSMSAGEVQSAFVADQAPMTVLDRNGTPVPGLEFDGEDSLSSGTITVWRPSTKSWVLTELTLG